MDYLPQAVRLLNALSGKDMDKVPNFEMFFDNPLIVKHYMGKEKLDFEEYIEFCKRIGWGSVLAAYFFYDFGRKEEKATDGTTHYSGGTPQTRYTIHDLIVPDINLVINEAVENIKKIHEKGLAAHIMFGHCFCCAMVGMGFEHTAMLCYDDFDFLKEQMETVEITNRQILRGILEAGAKPDFFVYNGDCAYGNSMVISPGMFCELVYDCTKETCDLLKANQIPYIFHTDGKIDDVCPILIDWGFSGTHGVEAQANNLREIKRRFGDRLTLIGNFDPVLITTGSVYEIAAATREMVETGKPGGRYVAAMNTMLKEYVPLENYLTFLKVIEESGKY